MKKKLLSYLWLIMPAVAFILIVVLCAVVIPARKNAEKAAKYEDMQEKYSDIMLSAESQSQSKISEANAKAEQIVSEAKERIENKERELEEIKSSILNSFEESKSAMATAKSDMLSAFDKVSTSLSEIYEKAKGNRS